MVIVFFVNIYAYSSCVKFPSRLPGRIVFRPQRYLTTSCVMK